MKILAIVLTIIIIILGISMYNQNKKIELLQYQINTFQNDRVKADDNLLEAINCIRNMIYK